MTDLKTDLATCVRFTQSGSRVAAEKFIHDHGDELLAAVEDLSALRDFAHTILNHAAEGCDVDGGTVQDTAERCGLLRPVEVSEACGEMCVCADYAALANDWPVDCYRRTSRLTGDPATDAAIAGRAEG